MAEHAHFMGYVKQLLKLHTNAYVFLAQQRSRLHCDNNDVTHKNKCEYNYHVCQAQEEPGIKHYGGCKRKSLLGLVLFLLFRILQFKGLQSPLIAKLI